MHNHHETHLLHYDVKKNLDLYIITTLRSFAVGISLLFIPILLYNDFWYSFSEVMLFYITHSSIAILINILSIKVINKLWSKLAILMWLLSLVLYFIIWGFIPIEGYIIYLLSMLSWTFTWFFWTGFHYNMSTHSDKKKEGSTIAKLNIIITIISAISPLIWGLIIQKFGYQYIFIVAIIIVLVAISVLFHSSQKHITQNITIKDVLANYKYTKGKKFTISIASLGHLWFSGAIFWPLFIYLIVPNFSKIWFISTLTSIITVLLLYIIGHKLDQWKDKKIIKTSINIQLLNRISRGIFAFLNIFNGIFITIIDTIHRLTHSINTTTLDKNFYTSEDKKINPLLKVINHEVSIHASRVVLLMLFIIINLWIPDKIMIYIAITTVIIVIPFQGLIIRE